MLKTAERLFGALLVISLFSGVHSARAGSPPYGRTCSLEVRTSAPMYFAAGNDRDFDERIDANEIEVHPLEAGEVALPFLVGNRHFVFAGRIPEGASTGDFSVTVVCDGWQILGKYDCSLRPARSRVERILKSSIFGNLSGTACAVTGIF